MEEALVSCLMVALPSARRLPLLKRSVAAYCAQTHVSRELVIALDEGPEDCKAAIVDHVAALGRSDIRVIPAPLGMSLGALRNFSRAKALGVIHCQWDDDDIYHPRRLERQYAALKASGAQAVCLQEVFLYFSASSELYWTNWRATEPTVFPATLMCLATADVRYPENGPNSRLGEDTDVILQFLQQKTLHAIVDAPDTYVYVCHGANTWGGDFHPMLANRLGLSQGLIRRRETRIRQDLAALDFGRGPIIVRGPNGIAFTIAL